MSEGRIQPGPLRGQISARAWNRAQDAADIVLGQRSDGTAAGPSDAPPAYAGILAKNGTTGTVNRWGVLSVAGVVFTPSGATGNATQQFQDQPVLSGGLPTGGSAFVVAVEPIGAGKIGRVAVAGVVQAKVNVTDAGHGFATAKDGDLTQLSSAASGEAQILWKESGTGTSKWAIVRFGGAAGASIRLGKVTGTWSKGATASVTQWKGDGSAAVTGPSGPLTFTAINRAQTVTGTWSKGATASVTQWKGDGSAAVTGPSGPLTFTAINRAQTVTGPTGGFWVGCESIDGTWHLEWAECV